MAALISHGADVNVKNEYGRTPLMWASSSGHEKVVESLLDAGADKEVKDNKGNTALALAEMFKKHDVVTLLERS